MEEKEIKVIFYLTSEVQDSVVEIYEQIADNELPEAVKNIDKTIAKLRHLKSNIVIKGE